MASEKRVPPIPPHPLLRTAIRSPMARMWATSRPGKTYLAGQLGTNVLNYGVAGYGTDQAYLKYRLGGHVDANIVILGIWPENINRVINRYRPFLHYDERLGLSKPIFVQASGGFELMPNPLKEVEDVTRLLDPSFIAELARVDYWFQRDSQLPSITFPFALSLFRWRDTVVKQFQLSMRKLVPSVPAAYPCNPFDEDGPFAVMCHIVDRFVETARSRGATPIIAIMAHQDQVREVMDYHLSRAQRLVSYLQAKNYPCIDLIQEMADMHPGPEQLQRWFIGHTSSEGNKVVADIIGRHLKKDYAHLIGSGNNSEVSNKAAEMVRAESRY